MNYLEDDLNFQEGCRLAKFLDENPCLKKCGLVCPNCIELVLKIFEMQDEAKSILNSMVDDLHKIRESYKP